MRSHKRPWLDRIARSTIPTCLLGGLALLLGAGNAAADTYTVTSTQCEGAGSIVEAMNLANTNPGEDTITFSAGLVVDYRTCPPNEVPPSENDYFALQAEESVIFEGNGAKLFGQQVWINPLGGNSAGERCLEADDYLATTTPGFIQVGVRSQDNSAITVTVRDLDMEGLSAVGQIEQNATLVIEDSVITKIYSGPRECLQPAVAAEDGANFTALRTRWVKIWNAFKPMFGTVYLGAIDGDGAGDLSIQESFFGSVEGAGAITWAGAVGSQANIVTSQFYEAGGIKTSGDTAGKIVNTLWASSDFLAPDDDERIINESSQPLEIIASTILFASDECDRLCQTESGGGLGTEGIGWVYRGQGGANINFTQSAVGVNFPFATAPVHAKLLDPNNFDAGPGFGADSQTFVMQTTLQDTVTLQAVTAQPALITDPPDGLPTELAYPERAVPLNPGPLIDPIADAECGNTNELLNPIDGSCITEDVFGNPRVDGSNARNIGAVQQNVAPHLTVVGVGNGSVDLSWTKPQDLTGTLTGYVLFYRESGSTGSFTEVSISGPDTLTTQVTGLTNGTEYEFLIDSFVDGGIGEVASNRVTATPAGTVQAPIVGALPSVCQTELSWNVPDAQGETIDHYTVSYRAVGDTDFTIVPASIVDTSYTVTGLSAETQYEFSVRAITTGGNNGDAGTTLATTTMAGDIDLSGTVTYNDDRPLFLGANGSSSGDARYVPNADLNCDGRINPRDYRLWYRAWIADGRQRSEPTPP